MVQSVSRQPLRLGSANPRGLALFAALYIALGLIGSGLRVSPDGIALLWPSTGLLLSYLALSPRQRWPLIALVAIAAELLLDAAVGGTATLARAAAFALTNALTAAAGAWMLLALVPQPWQRRQSIEIMAYMVVVALLMPVLGAFAVAQVLYASGAGLAEALSGFGAWWSGNVQGIALITPIVGGLILRIAVEPHLPPLPVRAAILVTAAVCLATAALLGVPADPTDAELQLRLSVAFTVCFGALVWFALTQEPLAVAVASFATAVTIGYCLIGTATPLRSLVGSDRYAAQAVQFLLLTFSLSAFLVSLVRFERRHGRALARLRRHAGSLLADMASRLSAVTADNIDAELENCLAALGRHALADRARLLEFDTDSGYLRVSKSWLRPEVATSELKLDEIRLADVADLVAEIRAGRTLFLSRRELPPDSPHRVWLERFGTRGSAFAPLRSRGRVNGAIMLTWVRRDARSTDEISTVLQATGQIVGNTLNRLRTQADEHTYRNELRGLAADLNRLDDRVRRETAIDLHDGAAQALAVARMKLAQLASGRVEPEATITLVDELVGKALAEIRGVIDQLSPTALYELGVDTALSEHCDDVAAKTGLAVRYDGPDTRLDVSDDEAVLLYRAARELIANAVKHADATALSLRLWQTATETALEVEDDGIGMNADVSTRKGRSGGLGLFSLTERLSHLGGWIRFDSTGRGTRVSLAIPRT